MVPVSQVGHLKQQMSVTWLAIGPQKVHKVGQLSGRASLGRSGCLCHLG